LLPVVHLDGFSRLFPNADGGSDVCDMTKANSTIQIRYAMNERKHVIVVGAGFGGLRVVQKLCKHPVEITLVDKTNHHLFQPLLYQVATAALAPGDIAATGAGHLQAQQKRACSDGRSREGWIQPMKSKSILKTTKPSPSTTWCLHPAQATPTSGTTWEKFAPGLKTLSDALDIRERILMAYEKAEREPDPEKRKRHETFVVVGGGPTGVELAGTWRKYPQEP
jgi:NADH:ubiquinone reductase (H+-translocating)